MTDHTDEPLGFWGSLSYAFSSTFSTIGDIGSCAQESVNVTTGYVHRRAVAHEITDKNYVVRKTAEELKTHRQALEADPELKTIFDDIFDKF